MKGRLRIHIIQNRMTYAEADTLSWYLEEQENVTEVKVYERTADAVICYKGVCFVFFFVFFLFCFVLLFIFFGFCRGYYF